MSGVETRQSQGELSRLINQTIFTLKCDGNYYFYLEQRNHLKSPTQYELLHHDGDDVFGVKLLHWL